MSPLFFHRRGRRLLVALAVGLTALLLAPAAAAHDVLTGSSPAEGEALAQSPEEIVLTFNNPPLDVGSVIAVEDTAGSRVVEAEGSIEGADVVLPLSDPLSAGEYTVVWRVASSDGHPIEGQIPFSVADSGEPTSQPTSAAPEPETADDAPATPESAQEGTTADDAADQVTDDGTSGLPTWAKVVIAVAAVGAVAGLIVIVARRLRSGR